MNTQWSSGRVSSSSVAITPQREALGAAEGSAVRRVPLPVTRMRSVKSLRQTPRSERAHPVEEPSNARASSVGDSFCGIPHVSEVADPDDEEVEVPFELCAASQRAADAPSAAAAKVGENDGVGECFSTRRSKRVPPRAVPRQQSLAGRHATPDQSVQESEQEMFWHFTPPRTREDGNSACAVATPSNGAAPRVTTPPPGMAAPAREASLRFGVRPATLSNVANGERGSASGGSLVPTSSRGRSCCSNSSSGRIDRHGRCLDELRTLAIAEQRRTSGSPPGSSTQQQCSAAAREHALRGLVKTPCPGPSLVVSRGGACRFWAEPVVEVVHMRGESEEGSRPNADAEDPQLVLAVTEVVDEVAAAPAAPILCSVSSTEMQHPWGVLLQGAL